MVIRTLLGKSGPVTQDLTVRWGKVQVVLLLLLPPLLLILLLLFGD